MEPLQRNLCTLNFSEHILNNAYFSLQVINVSSYVRGSIVSPDRGPFIVSTSQLYLKGNSSCSLPHTNWDTSLSSNYV